jgi:hypothetical protein
VTRSLANFVKTVCAGGYELRSLACAVSTSLLVTHWAQVYVLGESVQRILLLNVKLFCS